MAEKYAFKRLGVDHGLTPGLVSCFYEDHNGLLWIGTMDGLNVYDGLKVEQFKSGESGGLNSSQILSINDDPFGNMWVFTPSGPNLYKREANTFIQDVKTLTSKLGMPDLSVSEIIHKNNLWCFVHGQQGLSVVNSKGKIEYTLYFDQLGGTDKNVIISDVEMSIQGHIYLVENTGRTIKLEKGKQVEILDFGNTFFKPFGRLDYEIFVDSKENLWLFSQQTEVGIAFYNKSQKSWSLISKGTSPLTLNNNNIRTITEEENGNIWVGTDHGGINLVDQNAKKITYITHDNYVAGSIVQNSIMSLFVDSQNNMWIGTFKNGVNFYQRGSQKFDFVHNEAWNPASLPFNDVNCFVETGKNSLWIGTNGGGLMQYNADQKSFKTYKKTEQDPSSISSNIVVSLLEDHKKQLWIGTFQGGLNKMVDGRITRIPFGPLENEATGPNVWDIIEDSRDNLWFANLSEGLILLKNGENTFNYYNNDDVNNKNFISLNFVNCVSEDPLGLIWAGGGNGIAMIEKQTYLPVKLEKSNYAALTALQSNVITDLMNDGQGRMWIGTSKGMFAYVFSSGKLISIEEDAELSTANIQNIIRDDGGQVWVTTNNGLYQLSKIDLDGLNFDGLIRRYTTEDGLQGMGFNKNAILRLSDGTLYFGGSNGFNTIKPAFQQKEEKTLPIIFIDFKVLNKSVRSEEYSKSYGFVPSQSGDIILSHRDNVFTVDFISPDYNHASKIKYAYLLKGFDKQWTEITNFPSVTYTNLDAGEYVLRVKRTSANGVWSEEESLLNIKIRPPFWKTSLAYMFYLLAFGGILFYSRQRGLSKQRKDFELEQERREAHQLKELNAHKLNFFTNIGHELRTPISLIMAPLERLTEKPLDDADKKQIQVIRNNAGKLLKMVDQLLDFRKMEMDKSEIYVSTGDIVRFCEEIVDQFKEMAFNKEIQLQLVSNRSFCLCAFDKDKMEKILFNLLSNAMKFSFEKGKVEVILNLSDQKDAVIVELMVADDGIGIPEEAIGHIFDRYYTVNNQTHLVNHGTGIGLSIVKEFVEMHEGSISVNSVQGEGCNFVIHMKLAPSSYLRVNEDKIESPQIGAGHKIRASKKLVLVEDNEELSAYLTEIMEEDFQTVTAKDGIQGWKTILNEMPDIVISDVIMPGRNGLDLCEKVKNDPRTKHIPVILLTADNKDSSKLTGLKYGADDFVTKPFNIAALKARVDNLVYQRDTLQNAYSKKISIETVEEEITSRDEIFIREAMEIVHKEMEDAELNVEQLAAHMNLSRVALYKRLVNVTGKTPHQFIKDIRLDYARQLLERSQLSIAEVAYKVGYNDRKYFSKHFKETFGRLPSEWPKSS